MAPEDAAKNIKFIQEIEKQPCIYNFTLQEYTKKQATDSAWQKVAEEMKDTVHNCKERWRNLRTVFVRRMRPSPPDATGKKTTRPYYLTDAMQFLLPFVRIHHTTSLTDSPNRLLPPAQTTDTHSKLPSSSHIATQDVKEDIEEDTEDGDDDELSETSLPPREIDGLECPATTITTTTTATTTTTTTPTATTTTTTSAVQDMTASTRLSQNKKRKGCSVSSVDHTFVDVKKARLNSNYSSGGGGGDDPRKLFLLSLLPDVHAMSDVQMRKFRKLVLDAIDTVLDETPNGTPGYT